MRDHGEVQAGQTVLITGASGGVGSFAVQIAKAYGAEVTAVCSIAKVDMVRAVGADHVLDYTRDDFADGQHQYDVILDIGGNRRLSHLRRALTPNGRLVIVGGETQGRWLGGTDRQLRAHLLSLFVRHKLGTFISSENADDLLAMRDLIESGEIEPVIDRTYPLGDVARAIRYLLDGHARGKIVITVQDPTEADGLTSGRASTAVHSRSTQREPPAPSTPHSPHPERDTHELRGTPCPASP